MGGFRTRGWFGPQCPLTAPVFFLPLSFHDFNNTEDLPPQPIGGNVSIPLDVAMKIFWNASTYRIQSSLTATVDNVTRSESKDLIINWGDVSDARLGIGGGGIYPPRSGLTTAKEMLCEIQKQPIPINTLYTERPLGLFSADIAFELGAAPWLQTFGNRRVLRLPLDFAHSLRMLFPNPLGLVGAYHVTRPFFNEGGVTPTPSGNWSLNTPWGNFAFPLYSFPTVTSNSLTITVTEADPEERFA